ncbi:MAG: hypothetical protein ABFD66_03925 [Smithella sp.]
MAEFSQLVLRLQTLPDIVVMIPDVQICQEIRFRMLEKSMSTGCLIGFIVGAFAGVLDA